jgi:hypothetical protein
VLISNQYKTLALLIVPVLLAVVDFFFLKVAFPLHSGSPGYDQDPAYAYLFNGLLILEGRPPHHIDHPGTPLQLLFALTIFSRWGLTRVFGDRGLDIVDSVINNPEAYLHDMAVLLLVLNLAALTFFGRRIAEATCKIYLGMFCQLSLLSFTIMAPKATYPAPEALLIFCSLVLLGLLAPQIFETANNAPSQNNTPSKLIGASFATGLAVKITFAPTILLLIFFLKGQARRTSLFSFAITFALLTALAIPNFGRFVSWVTGLIMNAGIHGGGEAEFIDLAIIGTNAHNLFIWFPLLALTLVLASVSFTLSARNGTLHHSRSLWLLTTIISFQILLVIKHPGAHYMIGVLPICFICIALIYLKFPPVRMSVRHGQNVLVVLFVFHSIALTLSGIKKLTNQRTDMSLAMAAIHQKLESYPDALIICSFRCALPEYALTMGLIFAPQLISDKTTQRLKRFYDFDIFQSKLISPGSSSVTLDFLFKKIKNNQEILLITPKIYPALIKYQKTILLEYNEQSLYLLSDHKSE